MVPTRIGIAGLGAIGRTVVRALAKGMPGLELACVAARDHVKARAWLDHEGISCPIVKLEAMPSYADLLVECAPAFVLQDICRPMLSARKRVMVLSAGELLSQHDLLELAAHKGGQIIVPTGALIGLDAVTAAAQGVICSVRMTTRKPSLALVGAPYLVEHKINVEELTEAKCVFAGTAREAAAGFPANVNVVAALSLAGIGPDRTMVEIWADPRATRNCHSIEVDSDSARFSMTIENIPSENPRTGRITALSVLAALAKLHAPLCVGT
jgi:aspartate dehydrogenase